MLRRGAEWATKTLRNRRATQIMDVLGSSTQEPHKLSQSLDLIRRATADLAQPVQGGRHNLLPAPMTNPTQISARAVSGPFVPSAIEHRRDELPHFEEYPMPATNPNLIYDEPAGPFQSAPTRRPRTAAEIAAMTPEEQEALDRTIRATPETGHGWMTNILSHLTGPFSSDEREAWQMAETLGQPLEIAGVPMAYDAVSNIKRGIEEENSGDIARGVGQGALVALPGAAALRAASPVARAAAPAALGTLGGLAMSPEEAEARAEKRKRIQAKRESSLGHTPGKTIESHIDPKSGQRLMMSPEEGAARAHEREPSSIRCRHPAKRPLKPGRLMTCFCSS